MSKIQNIKFIVLFYLASNISLSLAAPGDIIYQNLFNNNTAVNADWTRNGGNGNDFQSNTATFSSAPRSLRIRDSSGGTSNNGLINAAVPGAEVSFWLRQGSPSSAPESGEDLEFFYQNSSGTWILLQTYPGSDPAGTIYNATFTLPLDALHGNLRFRFNMIAGGNADRWYVDDFIVVETLPLETIPPVAVDDSASAITAGSINIDLAGNDTDADSGIDTASITIVSGPSNGTINSINADGTVDYTHIGNTTTSDSFTYTINDNIGNISNVATVSITIQLLSCEAYADDFNAGTFNNNTGTLNFSTAWNVRSVTVAGLGFVNMANNRLQIQGNNLSDSSISDPYDYDNNWAERNADLSSFDTATLRFDFIAVGGLEIEDEAIVEISSDGGLSFTTLQVFNGFTTTTTVPVSIDISSFISTTSDTRIRFRIQEDDNSTPCCFGATGEFIEIDNFEIQGCRVSTVDHYIITTTSPTVTCEPAGVVVTAVDISGNPVDIPGGTSLTMSTDIANDGWVNPLGANSNVYTLPADAGAVTFQLRKLTPATLEIDVDGSNGATDSDGNRNDDFIDFVDAGFKFYGNGVIDNIGPQIAGKASNLSPGSQVITLRAIQTDPLTGRCEALINNTSADIGFAYQCNNPNSCAIQDNGMAINGSAIVDDINVGFSNVTVNFDATGTGLLNFNYFDVGEITLRANANMDVAGVGPANVQGVANPFVVRPFGYDISVAGNPIATNGNDPVFATALNNFNTTIRSVLWESSDDQVINGTGLPGADGIPDPGADLGGNGVTPNIVNVLGNLSLSPTAQVVTNSNGILGTNLVEFLDFAPSGSANAGTAAVTQSWSEVGILTIDAATADFMGTGFSIVGVRPDIGRFIPANFLLSAPVVPLQCGIFTYAGFFDGVNPGLDRNGQVFDVSGTLTARNTANVTTLNYAGPFAKLINTDIAVQAFNNTLGANDPGRVNFNPPALNFIAGVSNYSAANTDYQYAGLAAPFDLRLDLAATDSDAVSSGLISSNAFEVRIGRLRLVDGFGSEINDLEMRLMSDYYDGTVWINNTDDSCTLYLQTDASFDAASYTDNLNDGETATFSPLLTQSLNNGISTISNGLWFSAPGVGNYGSVSVEINLAAQSWLQFDWDGDNTLDSTSGLLSFGHFRGSDRIIFWREIRN